MTKLDKELVIEDLDFIHEYIHTLMDRHPEIEANSTDILAKITRRMDDISKRIGA